MAQNSADAPPPKKKSAAAQEAETEQAAEAAEDETDSAEAPANGAEASPARDRKKRRSKSAAKQPEVTRTATATEDEPANVADAASLKQASELIEAGIIKLPSNNPAFPYLVQAPRSEPGTPPSISNFIPDSPLPNGAESRPGMGSTANQADSRFIEPAEPPTPDVPTDEPGQAAGEPGAYVPPQLQLEVPDIEMLPPPLPAGEYVRPEREYLEWRPLPPLDETETDEERIAANVEQSLKLIDLGGEQREQVQMPLAPGVLAYSADEQIQVDRRNRKYILKGNAAAYYGDIAIWADLIEINDSAASAYAKGYVAIQRQDDILYANEAYVNYDTQVLELFNVEGNTGGPRIQGTLYFFAHRAFGTFDRLILDAPELTTCDPLCGDPKEVHISAHKAVYKARSSITLSDVYFYVREHKVFYIPAIHIPIPREQKLLENENSDLQQTYGYNFEDGFFAKFAYTYYQHFAGVDPETGQNKLSGPLLGVAKLDLSQKRGPGFGIRQDLYNPSLGVTLLRFYYQEEWDWLRETLADGTRAQPERNLELDFNQELNLSKALQGNISIDRTDTIRPSGTNLQGGGRRSQRTNTWSNRFDLAYVKGDTNARLAATQSINTTGGQPDQTGNQLRRVNTNTNVTLSLDQQITDEVRLNASEVYSSIKGQQSGVPADQEGNFTASVNFSPKADSPLKGYTGRINVQKQTDLDGDKNRTAQDQNRSIREELPAIEIGLPSDLISDNNFFNSFRINLDNLVTGTRRRPESAFRAKFQAAGDDTWQISRGSRLQTRLALSQYFYDDGNAQYVIAPNANYSYDSFNGWRFNASYRLQFQQGVRNPPVQGDAVRYAQDLNYDFTFTNYRSWRWRLSSGFDLTHTPYAATPEDPDDKRWYTPRPITSQFTWDPNEVTSFSHTTNYNLLTDEWGPTVLGASLRSPYTHPDGYYNWYLGLGLNANTNYLTQWQTTSLDVDWFKKYERGWSTQVIASFRPDRGQTDIEDMAWDDIIRRIVVRKQNCCTTLEFGWRVGIDEYYVNAYLNALPQYPARITRGHTSAEGVFYDLAFPTDRVFSDVQQELFPGSQIPGGLGGFL